MDINQIPATPDSVYDDSGNHIQFGDNNTVTSPPGLDAPSNDVIFHPQPFGHIVPVDDDGAVDGTGRTA